MAKVRATRGELIHEIAKRLDFTLKKATQTYETIMELFEEQLKNGRGVPLMFGYLDVVSKERKMAINPKTLEKVEVPARKVVRFKVTKSLKDKLVE